MSPEPSTTCRIIVAGGEEADNHSKPTRNTSVRKMAYSSSLLDASFGTLVDDTDSEFETDDHPYLLTLATTTGADSLVQAEAERRLSVESRSGSAATAEGRAAAAAAAEPSGGAAPLVVDSSSATTGNPHRVVAAPPEKSCSYNTQAEDTTTAETEDETQQDDDDEEEEEEGDDDDDEIGSEVDDFSLTSDLGFSQEDDLCHDYYHHNHQDQQEKQACSNDGGGGRLAFIFDMLPAGGGGGRRGRRQRSSSMGFGSGNSDHDRLNQSMHGGIAAPGDALSKTIHGGACTSGGGQNQHHHMSPIQEKRPSSGEEKGAGGGSDGTTTRGRRSSRPSIGTVKQRVSDYEVKRLSCGSIATNASSGSDCARGRESYPPPTTSRGRPTLLSPTSWGSNRFGSSLSPVPRGSCGSTGVALSPIRRGISPLRILPGGSPWSTGTKSTARSRNTCCPRRSPSEFLHGNSHRGSNTTIPLDLVDLDEQSVGGASFKTFNTMNMDHSATGLQRNISGSAFAMRRRFATADIDGFPTIRERKGSNNNKRASNTTGQKINSFVENQFTTFAKNVDGIQDKFEKMTTNMGETAQVIQEEPNSRVLGAVVQARLSCFAGNLQHIRKSTCFLRNLRTICGLPNTHNHYKDNNNNHGHYNNDDFDPFGDFDTTDRHRLYSHQDKMY